LLLLLGGLALSGCLPSGQSSVDEEKESHFLLGKSRVSELDYKGAIEAFEKALEVNPRSAAAHFELALLYEKKGTEPAAAIYHYEQYLRLRPTAENADILVRPHVLACKQEIARTVSLGAVTERQQHEFERLADENNRLKTELQAWQARYVTNQPGPPPAPESPAVRVSRPAESPSRTLVSLPPSAPSSQPRILAAAAGGSASSRSHTIKAGETPTIIARKYGVKVDALMAANPRVDSRHLKVGQVLAVPSL
jgi:tetratricopeptide (TPR) repeat protein